VQLGAVEVEVADDAEDGLGHEAGPVGVEEAVERASHPVVVERGGVFGGQPEQGGLVGGGPLSERVERPVGHDEVAHHQPDHRCRGKAQAPVVVSQVALQARGPHQAPRRRREGPRRGQPLGAAGLDEIVRGAWARGGIPRLTCHQLRHTWLTRLREAGMALEALQAQAGHRSIESTRVYLHLANDWLAGEYRRAVEAIEAQSLGGA
jgi:hypothetical protein